MNRISLLDCTLRDGGYINDWEFGHDELICLYERIVSSGVDIIEGRLVLTEGECLTQTV